MSLSLEVNQLFRGLTKASIIYQRFRLTNETNNNIL